MNINFFKLSILNASQVCVFIAQYINSTSDGKNQHEKYSFLNQILHEPDFMYFEMLY